MTLFQFQVVRPPYELNQDDILEWVAAAHAKSAQDTAVGTSILSQLRKMRLGRETITSRGVSLGDCLHQNWNKMEVYEMSNERKGAGFAARTSAFNRITTAVLTQFYPEGTPLPSHLIHVTCTGYIAPSPAQKLVALRKAGQTTVVTHAYHMGCYAAIPVMRLVQGLEGTIDIVHTEVCSLHMNPSLHSLDQLIVQALFGDGFIKYSVSKEPKAGFQVLAIKEIILSESLEAMKWECDDWGMKMTLSKEVPTLIVQAIDTFVDELLEKAQISEDEPVYFAIHPGGPKIIKQIATLLKLEVWQFSHSIAILKHFGNMSSATLPHIWASMWEDPLVEQGAKIISLAFGPGLTLAGAVLQCNR